MHSGTGQGTPSLARLGQNAACAGPQAKVDLDVDDHDISTGSTAFSLASGRGLHEQEATPGRDATWGLVTRSRGCVRPVAPEVEDMELGMAVSTFDDTFDPRGGQLTVAGNLDSQVRICCAVSLPFAKSQHVMVQGCMTLHNRYLWSFVPACGHIRLIWRRLPIGNTSVHQFQQKQLPSFSDLYSADRPEAFCFSFLLAKVCAGRSFMITFILAFRARHDEDAGDLSGRTRVVDW